MTTGFITKKEEGYTKGTKKGLGRAVCSLLVESPMAGTALSLAVLPGGGVAMTDFPRLRNLVNQNLRRFGYQIRRAEPDWIDFIMDRHIDTVLDIGANVGQFAELLRVKGYRGRIISFEPVRVAYQELAAKAADDDGWEVHNFALGRESGETTINVSDYSVFSSILPVTGAAVQFDKGANVTGSEKIAVRRLDDVGISMSGNLFIKIDTQGFEKPVLEGGRRVMASAKGVLMELPIIHLYEGTWRLHEAIEYMFEAGFVPAQIHPVNHHSTDNVSLVEVDCLFRPWDSSLD